MSNRTPSPFEGLSRRRWLTFTIATTAALAGTVALWPEHGKRRHWHQRSAPLRVFDAVQGQVLVALAEAVLPQGQGFPPFDKAQVIERLDEELFFVSNEIRADVATGLRALEYLPFLYGKTSRFTRLSVLDRQDVLTMGSSGRLDVPRAVCAGLRQLVQLVYFGHASTWHAMRYDGPFAGISPMPSEQREHHANWVRQQVVLVKKEVRP